MVAEARGGNGSILLYRLGDTWWGSPRLELSERARNPVVPAGRDPINTRRLLIFQLWHRKNASVDIPIDRSRREDVDNDGCGWDQVPPRPETTDRVELRIMWWGGVRTRSEISNLPPRCGDAARSYIKRPAGQPRRIRKQTLVQFGRCEHPKTPFTLHHQCNTLRLLTSSRPPARENVGERAPGAERDSLP